MTARSSTFCIRPLQVTFGLSESRAKNIVEQTYMFRPDVRVRPLRLADGSGLCFGELRCTPACSRKKHITFQKGVYRSRATRMPPALEQARA